MGRPTRSVESILWVAEPRSQGTLGIADIYRADKDTLVRALRTVVGKLPPSHWDKSLNPEQEFERYVELGHQEAMDLETARSLGRPNGILSWIRRMK